MKKILLPLLFTLLPVLAAPGVAGAPTGIEPLPAAMRHRMVDPSIDDEGPFCYLSRPNNQLGVPGANRGAQVTFDGSVYTGGVEFFFLYGGPLQTVMVRQKTLLEGWIPVIQYGWRDGGVRYDAEMFAERVDGLPETNPVNFIRLTVVNETDAEQDIVVAGATRLSGDDHRFHYYRQEPFSPDWMYEFRGNGLVRNGKLVAVFAPGGRAEAVPGVVYTEPFNGRDHHIFEESAAGLMRYEFALGPGESRALDFAVPTWLADAGEEGLLEAVVEARYDDYRARTIAKWRDRLAEGARFVIPEEKVQDTWRSGIAYMMQAIWTRDGQLTQAVNKFQYTGFWLRDAAYILRCYGVYGFHDLSDTLLRAYPRYQRENGLFQSQEGQLDGFGQALYTLAQHAFLTADFEFARRVYPHFPPAVSWLAEAREENALGLMPATLTHDNELLQGHYTGHNFWALVGLRSAVRLARMTGENEDAQRFEAEYRAYRQRFLEELQRATDEKEGYIPPGLDADGGQDWGNLIGLFPSEVLEPDDPRIGTTLDILHREKFREGVMTYRWGIHHYLTVKETQNHVFRGEQEDALRHFYAILLHTGSANELFEWEAVPWGDRDVGANFPPHGWGSAMLNLLLRNMLIHERGGNGGLDGREIVLFPVVSPEWAQPGKEIRLHNAPTEVGPVSAVYRFLDDGAELVFEPALRQVPIAIRLAVPYFVELESVESTDEWKIDGDEILLAPASQIVRLRWTWKDDVEPLSYERTVAEYKAEYRRRFETYIQEGGEPVAIEAPRLYTLEEREREFMHRYGPKEMGIAVGRPVTTSSPPEADHPPELAVDGNTADKYASSWWAGPPAPQWMQVDLEEVHSIDRVHVYPFWDGWRFYQYVVDLSEDGESWTRVADMSGNERRATSFGDRFEFDPVDARYLRVTMLFNSANTSFHLVEVKAFAVE